MVYFSRVSNRKGYEVHGILRRSSSFNTARIEHLYLDEWVRDMKKDRLVNLHYGDMTDSSSLIRIIQQVQPDEIYNLAAQSHVKVSLTYLNIQPEADAINFTSYAGGCPYSWNGKEDKDISGFDFRTIRFGTGSSTEGNYSFYPRSPYGVWPNNTVSGLPRTIVSYGMYAVNGILLIMKVNVEARLS